MKSVTKLFFPLALFVLFAFIDVTHLRAEHIFFRAAINGVRLNETSAARIAPFAAADSSAPTIISPDGVFTFTFTIFDDDSEPGGGLLNLEFFPTSTANTLPDPTDQVFNYNGSGTERKPVIFSFTQPYNTSGRWEGLLRGSFIDDPNERAREFRFTLVSTAAVPEPATLILLGTGVAGIAGAIRRSRQRKAQK